ncbi:MAG: heme exporter protein CcmD [Gammaproteobacteria bacterium]
MSEFLHMGGYAFYVWTSYGLALIILLFNLVSPVVQRRRLLHEMARNLKREKTLQ